MTDASKECLIHCCDYWPPGRLTKEKMEAYKALEAAGRIRIRSVILHKETQAVTVDYFSSLPKEWIHDMLREVMV